MNIYRWIYKGTRLRSCQVRAIFLLISLAATLSLVGCASTHPHDPQDPYQNFNRKVFAFNMAVDKVVTKPIAKAYNKVTPDFAKTGVINFFSNIDDVSSAANSLLQGNLIAALSNSWRVVFNTTLGIGGLFDVASHLGLKKDHEDFGQTLAVWGVKRSPYLVLPLLGPSTARDTFGYAVNSYVLSPWIFVHPFYVRYIGTGVNLVSRRAELLPADKLVEQAFDPYIFVRDAYMQRREVEIEHSLNDHPFEEMQNSETPVLPEIPPAKSLSVISH